MIYYCPIRYFKKPYARFTVIYSIAIHYTKKFFNHEPAIICQDLKEISFPCFLFVIESFDDCLSTVFKKNIYSHSLYLKQLVEFWFSNDGQYLFPRYL